MHQLPADIQKEFEGGNFVDRIKIYPDQSQEWLNGIGKKDGGIVGITKTLQHRVGGLCHITCDRMALETRAVFDIGRMDALVHNESTKGRLKLDTQD